MPSRWIAALLLACTLLLRLPAEAAPEEPPTGLDSEGFVTRAERAELVVVGRVTGVETALIGGSVRFHVDRILRGKWKGSVIEFRSGTMPGRSLGIDRSEARWVLALDKDPESIDWHWPNFPPGRSWHVALDDRGWLHGDLFRVNGATVKDGGAAATNEPERMRLAELESRLKRTSGRLRESPGPFRTIDGQVFDSQGKPRPAELEVEALVDQGRTIRFSTDSVGRFRLPGLPDGAVWLRSQNSAFEPMLVPPGVRHVRLVVPWYGDAEQLIAERMNADAVVTFCDMNTSCQEDPTCRMVCRLMVSNAPTHACQHCLADAFEYFGTPTFEAAPNACFESCIN